MAFIARDESGGGGLAGAGLLDRVLDPVGLEFFDLLGDPVHIFFDGKQQPVGHVDGGGARLDLDKLNVFAVDDDEAALQLLDVDHFGLDDMDSRLLRAIIERFDGGPVGLGTIAAAIGEDPGTIEVVYEPFLVQNGFLQRTPRGRVATAHAYRHLGFVPPVGSAEQPGLF